MLILGDTRKKNRSKSCYPHYVLNEIVLGRYHLPHTIYALAVLMGAFARELPSVALAAGFPYM